MKRIRSEPISSAVRTIALLLSSFDAPAGASHMQGYQRGVLILLRVPHGYSGARLHLFALDIRQLGCVVKAGTYGL